MKFKFNRKKLLEYTICVIVIGVTTFILASCVAILVHVIQNGAPSNFGIYG